MIQPIAETRALLAWFDAHRRRLPWRRSREPYAVWVSEVMLQQTRVETVIPYFERFVERFPSERELAAATGDEVLALWSGLGYYRRARQMHRTAALVAARGGWPTTAAELAKLPGIGPYTAAAVASIAFGEVVPVLDGNVARVMARRLALDGLAARAAVRRHLATAAAGLLLAERPGDSNQALMELGATLCLPQRPDCPACPLGAGCRAAALGRPQDYPRRPAKAPRRKVKRLAVWVEDRGRMLLCRRPEHSGVLAGTWELPWIDDDGAGEPLEAGLARRYGGTWRLGEARGVVRHAITIRDLEVEVRRGELTAAGGVAEGVEAGWFAPEELARLPLSSLVGKILRLAAPGSPTPPARRAAAARRRRSS